MSHTVKRIDEMEGIYGAYKRARAELEIDGAVPRSSYEPPEVSNPGAPEPSLA